MTPQQLERMLQMNAEGRSSREIAAEPGMPSHATIAKWLNRKREKAQEAQGFTTATSEALNRTVKVYSPLPVNPVNPEAPVLQLARARSLVGLRLTPAELLDAKDSGALPFNAWLDAWGRVEVREPGAEPLWPAYSAVGLVQGLKNRYGVARAERARPANRQREGSK